MPQVTYPQVNNIITNNGELFIPDLIEDSILNSIVSPLNIVAETGDILKSIFNPKDRAVTLDYNSSTIIDAYSLYYMRRNTIIPRVALRTMVMNAKLQQFQEKLKVLDIGSGTGAVVIGLLEMFLHHPLNIINIQVDAIDVSQSCLDRLKQHLRMSGLTKFNVQTSQQDITDTNLLNDYLSESGPYDLIFVANVFNEISHQQSCDVIRCLSTHLKDTAMIVVVSAQRDYIKQLQPLLVTEATNDGLFVYYPCPSSDPSPHNCWIWCEHDYKCRQIRRRSGQFITSGSREQLVATWLYLSNQDVSIFDDFRNNAPELDWGVFRIWGKDSQICQCEICFNAVRSKLPQQKDSIKRGAIVGFSGNPPQIQRFFNL